MGDMQSVSLPRSLPGRGRQQTRHDAVHGDATLPAQDLTTPAQDEPHGDADTKEHVVADAVPSAPELPIETWQYIFVLSCRDDGRTGRSLSLVSRRFHAVSGPMRYQCLAVYGKPQLSALFEVLSASPHAPNIQHLFVTDSTTPGVRSRHEGLIPVDERRRVLLRPTQQELEDFGRNVDRLLTLAAPTLRSFFFHPIGPNGVGPYNFTAALPSLRALSTSQPDPWMHPDADAPRLERLERFHLHGIGSGFWRGGDMEERLRALLGAPAALTHLRQSGVMVDDGLGPFIEQQLREPSAALPALRSICVQPGQHTGMPIHAMIVYELRMLEAAMNARPQGAEGVFVLLRAQGYDQTHAEYEWRDYVNGGEGCWPST